MKNWNSISDLKVYHIGCMFLVSYNKGAADEIRHRLWISLASHFSCRVQAACILHSGYVCDRTHRNTIGPCNTYCDRILVYARTNTESVMYLEPVMHASWKLCQTWINVCALPQVPSLIFVIIYKNFES